MNQVGKIKQSAEFLKFFFSKPKKFMSISKSRIILNFSYFKAALFIESVTSSIKVIKLA